jgi:hypothetical protein
MLLPRANFARLALAQARSVSCNILRYTRVLNNCQKRRMCRHGSYVFLNVSYRFWDGRATIHLTKREFCSKEGGHFIWSLLSFFEKRVLFLQ